MRDRALFELEISGLQPQHEYTEAQHELVEQVKNGVTHYLTIFLNATTPKETGAYVPPRARGTRTVDVIVFFHGNMIPECRTCQTSFEDFGINYYWNLPKNVALRRDLAASGRPAVLLVPRFDAFVGGTSASKFGDLDKSNRFDWYLEEALKQLRSKGAIQADAELGDIVLAAHSGGGKPMEAVLNATNKYGKQIVACWGFENLYWGAGTLKSWLKANPKKVFRLYRRKKWKQEVVNLFGKPGNFKDTDTAQTHCGILDEFWGHALTAARSDPGTPFTYELEDDEPQGTGSGSGGSSGGTGGGANQGAQYTLKTWSPLTTATKLASDGSKKAFDKAKAEHPSWTPAQLPAFVQVQQAPSKFLKTILRRASALARADSQATLATTLDPAQWFKNFTRISFLGLEFEPNEYAHVEMAKKLQEVEAALVQQLGGTPKTVGETLLHNRGELHKASRRVSGTAAYSMHMFGLAIDVNYLGNPFLQDEDLGLLNTTLKNASQLLRPDDLRYARPQATGFYDSLARLDELLQNYFSLLDDANALRARLDASPRGSWRGKSAASARSTIKRDFQSLAKTLERKSRKRGRVTEDLLPIFKARGILDIDKRFVDAMEAAGFHWGAWYGDIMHFDLRSTGVGKYVERARLEHGGKAKRQVAKLMTEGKHGYHEFVD